MSHENNRPFSYRDALSIIYKHSVSIENEIVSLLDGFGRVSFGHQKTKLPEPGYDQSLRDGFAVGRNTVLNDDGRVIYQIAGEIPAGQCDAFTLKPAEAYRIMTGALLPKGAVAVVPQEKCFVEKNQLYLSQDVLHDPGKYIQKQGSVIESGVAITRPGEMFAANHIALLASTGVKKLAVYRKPRVLFFCSGSELVDIECRLRPGQKASSNRYLLHCLVEEQGAIPIDYGIIQDDCEQIRGVFSEIKAGDADIIISTGGLGPGKYDLLEKIFTEVGGELLYRSLNVRPGKSTLLGMIGKKLYFGLPGPPSAVSVLFNELIGPAVRKMQGMSEFENRDADGRLTHDVTLRSSDILYIKDGIITTCEDHNKVRFADRTESPNCCILLPAGVSRYREGDRVTIHKKP